MRNMLNDNSQTKGRETHTPLIQKPEEPRKTVQVPYEVHKRLRQIAFDKDVPIHEIITEALDKLER